MQYSDLKSYENPKHRIREVGAGSLTTAEILSVALMINNVETAQRLAQEYQQAGNLARIPREKILAIKGMGEGYVDAISAIVELTRRELVDNKGFEECVNSPQRLFDLVGYEMSALDHEEFWVVALDTRNRIKKVIKLYKGTLNMSNVRVAEVFRVAIQENCASIVVLHNHPSGDPQPSSEDINLTRALIQAGKLMDIEVIDHLIIGLHQYVSLKQKGLAF